MAFQDEKDAQLLEQMTDEEFWQRARMIATQAATILAPPEGAVLHEYLECELQRGTYFVHLRAIEAVIPASPSLVRLPFAPPWLQGVQAWRGEIVAVVDLDHYLCGIDADASRTDAMNRVPTINLDGRMLLVARHPECAVGLGVPGVGLTTSIESGQLTAATELSPLYSPARAAVIQGMYNGSPVLDITALLADVALQIEMAAHYD